MYNVKDICGTLYSSEPTTAGDLMQTILWSYNHIPYENLPFSYANIRSIMLDSLRNWGTYYDIDTNVLTHKQYNGDGNTEGKYCSIVTSDSEDMIRRWTQVFDLNLHDAAVSYTYLAAQTGNETYATIACRLWGYSRQLRVDEMRENARQYYSK